MRGAARLSVLLSLIALSVLVLACRSDEPEDGGGGAAGATVDASSGGTAAIETPRRAATTPRGAATTPPGAAATPTPTARPASDTSGCRPSEPVYVCVDEPQDGAHLSGTVRFRGHAASPLRGDLVLTLTDAKGDDVILQDLARPRTGGHANWTTSIPIPPNSAGGPATLKLFIADREGATAQVIYNVWIDR